MTILLISNGAANLLRVSTSNSRYLVNQAGNVVILAGAHFWNNLQEVGQGDPPPDFDYTTWLAFIKARGNNAFRLWAWEQSWQVAELGDTTIRAVPNIYARSGTAGALDGKNKWDLTTFNQSYFDRLRSRVIAAGNLGMYAIVMLFNGWSVTATAGAGRPWRGHPYNASNNINSINGDTNADDDGHEIEDLSLSAVTTKQEAYVAKVIDTLNDLDNVLYEICNEGGTVDWLKHFCDYIHTYEAGQPKQHPVGVNEIASVVYTCNADWVSINSADVGMDDPAAYAGSVPNLMDSDHNGGEVYGFNPFRQFCQGSGGVLMMDSYDGSYATGYADVRADSSAEYTRNNLGRVLTYAARMDLLNCTPQGALCSTGYCLRKADAHYLCYQPGGTNFTLDLTEASGTFNIEWLKCSDGTVSSGGTTTGGASRTLTPPGSDYVALVYK